MAGDVQKNEQRGRQRQRENIPSDAQPLAARPPVQRPATPPPSPPAEKFDQDQQRKNPQRPGLAQLREQKKGERRRHAPELAFAAQPSPKRRKPKQRH